MTSPKANGYPEEFKKMLLELYLTKASSGKEIEEEYGVSRATLSLWAKEANNKDSAESSQLEAEQMRKENAKLKEQVALLKKVLGVFAQHMD